MGSRGRGVRNRFPECNQVKRRFLTPFRFIRLKRAPRALPREFHGFSEAWRRCPMVLGSWLELAGSGTMDLPRETGSGTAGTQPDKGYPGQRCAKGASSPGRGDPSGVVFLPYHWTPSPCLKKSSGEASCLVRTYVRARFSRMNPNWQCTALEPRPPTCSPSSR